MHTRTSTSHTLQTVLCHTEARSEFSSSASGPLRDHSTAVDVCIRACVRALQLWTCMFVACCLCVLLLLHAHCYLLQLLLLDLGPRAQMNENPANIVPNPPITRLCPLGVCCKLMSNTLPLQCVCSVLLCTTADVCLLICVRLHCCYYCCCCWHCDCCVQSTTTAFSHNVAVLIYFNQLNKYKCDSPPAELALQTGSFSLCLVLPAAAEYAQKDRLQCFECQCALCSIALVLRRRSSSSSRGGSSDSSLVPQSLAPAQQAVRGHYTSAQQRFY
jgi:hypothetical protein